MELGSNMRAFWDQKAQDNPLWYVTTTLDYASPDQAEFWAGGEAEVARVLSDAGIDGGVFAAEIGCGVGRLTRALANRFERVWACDVSPRMIEHARDNLSAAANVTFADVAGDGLLPLPDHSTDFVLSMQVFHHIPDRRVTLSYIREAGRVLVPGGRLGFQLRTCRMGDPLLGPIERKAREIVESGRRRRNPPPADLDDAAWHGSRIGLWEIRCAARAAGMRVERVRWLVKDGANVLVICRKGGPRASSIGSRPDGESQ